MPPPVTSAMIEAEARRWLGTRFLHQGRRRRSGDDPGGVDCGGLVVGVGQALGQLPDYVDVTNYSRQPTGFMRELLRRHLVHVSPIEQRQGDIMLIAWAQEPQHLAILTGTSTIIHAHESAGEVVENSFSGRHLRRLHSVWRFKGANY